MVFRSLWNKAKQWRYVAHDPCEGLVLPQKDQLEEQPCFDITDVQKIIALSPAPYNLVWWTAFETGMRRGELCALNVGDVDLVNAIVVVRRSRWLKHITDTKSRRPRVFSLSPQLVEKLKFYVEGRNADEPLFLTPVRITKAGKHIGGVRLESNNLVKRHLKPILKNLGLKGAAHAFRHGNATLLDGLNTPMAVRQARLGHVDSRTTMGYTHLVSADDRQVSAQIGARILDPRLTQMQPKTETA